jgi:F-type H+-transporting ATPase subunit a
LQLAYQPESPYAIEQFKVHVLVPMELFGVDVSFTTYSQAMITTVLLLSIWMIWATRERELIPGRMQASVEVVYSFVESIVIKNAGEEARRTVPFVFTVFVFTVFATLLGLTPLKVTITSHIIVTLGLAAIVFGYANVLAVKLHGAKALKFFVPAGVPVYVLPLVVLSEVVSYLMRPVTLALRLFANIFAGHVMLKLFADFCVMIQEALGSVGLIPVIGIVVMMTILYAVETCIVIIQGYIFVLLTSMYIRDAIKLH